MLEVTGATSEEGHAPEDFDSEFFRFNLLSQETVAGVTRVKTGNFREPEKVSISDQASGVMAVTG